MKLFSALPLLLSLESSLAFASRNLQAVRDNSLTESMNATATKFYEPPAAFNDTTPIYYNDTVYPDGFWMGLNGSFVIYDMYGLMNDTEASAGLIQYAPMAVASSMEFNLTDMPVAYFTTVDNTSLPLFNVPMSFLRGAVADNTTLPPVQFATAMAMDAPQVMYFSTSPAEDVAMMMDSPVYIPISLGDDMRFDPPEGLGVFNATAAASPVVLERIDSMAMQSDVPVVTANVTVMADVMDAPVVQEQPPPVEVPVTGKPVMMEAGTQPLVQEPEGVLVTTASTSGNSTKVKFEMPAWWDRIKANYNGTDLKSCKRRKNLPPIDGNECSKKKTCYFGNQKCSTAYPDTVCTCNHDKVWSCSQVFCP